MIIDSIFDEILSIDNFTPYEIVGCSSVDMEELLEVNPVFEKVPDAFRRFLELGGRKMSYFHPVNQFFFHSILGLNKSLQELIRKPEMFAQSVYGRFFNVKDAEHFFVFGRHFQSGTYFFDLQDPNSPKILFVDDEPQRVFPLALSENFEELFTIWCKDFIEIHQEKLLAFPELKVPMNEFKNYAQNFKYKVLHDSKYDNLEMVANLRNLYDDLENALYSCYLSPKNGASKLGYVLGSYPVITMGNNNSLSQELELLAKGIYQKYASELKPLLV